MPSYRTGFSDACLLSVVGLLQKLLQKGTESAWRSGALKQVQIAGRSAGMRGSRQARASADKSFFSPVHAGMCWYRDHIWFCCAPEV